MQRQDMYLDLLEVDEVPIRRQVTEGMPKRGYSPRFESRRAKNSLSGSGAHRRRMKRGCM